MSEQNVVSFPGVPQEVPEQTITLEKQPFNMCQHAKISLDSHQRLVNCAQCGAVLDPFEYLVKNAVVLRRAWTDHASVKHVLADMNDRAAALKKEEQRLKASVRRLKEKQPVIDTRGKGTL
ncbi:hypothetical protein [Herbaspirillum huttiense]|uniref:hypothetical protein n=1 Tax=Herbaspirillum huttiense TaxID=863372 RepID=UPI0031D40BEC